ncbi:unnamed protein product [Effrenium voratum]|uniref:Uncharacterized protein n=1 Tax=Effrenium voratum TaxID=2562239 RepID=A0AA36JKP7_9DINO|nr:unnamed protein product [Effrenium voratum]
MSVRDAWGLSIEQEDALLSVLRVAADGELALEQARCRLCEVREFDPNDFFRSLFGNWSSTQQGWVSVHDVYGWLGRQPHSVAGILLEEVAAVLSPYLNTHGELRYDGFLRFVLPHDPSYSWLKEAALLRSGCRAGPGSSSLLPSEVCHRFCRIVEGERDLLARLGVQRRRLAELQPQRRALVAMLSAPGGPRHALVDRLKVLDDLHCEALLRRVGGAGVAAEDIVDFVLQPHPGWIRGSPEMRAFQSARSEGARPPLDSPRSSPRSARSVGLASHAAAAARQVAAEANRGSPRQHSPWRTGPGGAGGPGAPLEPPYWQSREWPRETNGRSRSYAGIQDHGRRPVSDLVLPAHQISPPPPPLMEPARPTGLYQPSKVVASPHSVRPTYEAAPVGFGGMVSAFPSAGPRPQDPGAPGPAERSSPGARPASPRPQLLPVPRAASPAHRSWLVEAGCCAQCGRVFMQDSVNCSRCGARRDGSPVRDGRGSPRVGRGSPLRESLGQSLPDRPSPRALSPRASPRASSRLAAPDGFFEGPLLASVGSEQRVLRSILQAMVRQAACDAEAEDAKAMIGPGAGGCGLPGFVQILDPLQKGYVLDTDLLELGKEHDAAVSFASLCSMIHEADLRRGGRPLGHLTFRDVGKLMFPIDSKEYKAMCDACSDDDAKSVLYVLHFSEPCPRCGFRIQRDSDSSGCPNVVCTHCQAPFRCYVVARDSGPAPSAADRYTLYRLVAAAARTAENLELDRKRLAAQPGFDNSCLREAFNYISSGRPSFDTLDLRQAFRDQQIPVSEKETDLMWQRYAPNFGSGVSLEHFQRQLRYDPMWTPESCTATSRLLAAVVQTLLRQAAADGAAEDAKALRPKGCPLTALFESLDPTGKGYLLDTDFWQLLQDFRGATPFAALCTMIQEVQLRRRAAPAVLPGRLSLREFGVLIYPVDSEEYEALRSCSSDAEAKSELYVLQHSEPCPSCGCRVQRDTDASGCPEVPCPRCRTVFRCTRQATSDDFAVRLSVQARQQLYRIISAAAHASEELEKDRLRLAQLLGHDITALSDVFTFLAQGRQRFTLPDLRRALAHLQSRASQRDLNLMWRRYAAQGAATVSFSDFLRQLKPLTKAGPF